jgi:hypothetical protein
VHCIVPGGGLSPDGARRIACRNGFFLPVRVLSRLFRHLFLQGLEAMHPPTNCSSSPISASSNTPTRGELTSRRCARANGSSMPKSPSPVLSRSWPISRDGHDHALPRVVPCCGFDPTESPMSKPRSLQNVQFAVVPPCTPSPRLEKKRARRGRHRPLLAAPGAPANRLPRASRRGGKSAGLEDSAPARSRASSSADSGPRSRPCGGRPSSGGHAHRHRRGPGCPPAHGQPVSLDEVLRPEGVARRAVAGVMALRPVNPQRFETRRSARRAADEI